MIRRLFLMASCVLMTAAVAQAARFTVDPVGPSRIMKKVGVITTTLHDAGGVDTFVSGKSAKDPTGTGAVTVFDTTYTFGATPSDATLKMTFSKVGPIVATYDIGSASKALLLKPAAKGQALESAMLLYSVNVLEQRKLGFGKTFGTGPKKKGKLGDVLKGGLIQENFVLITKNKLPSSVTNVTVAVPTGGVPVSGGLAGNVLTIGETLVNSPSDTNLPLTGRLTAYDPKVKVTNVLLPILSAEAASVGDPGGYKDLKVAWSANVGIAKKYMKKPTSLSDFGDPTKMTVLHAGVAAGDKLASIAGWDGGTETYSLASKLAPKGTLAEDATLAGAVSAVSYTSKGKVVKNNLKGLYKGIGSEAEIVASTAIAANADITMQWRLRMPNERKDPKATGPLPIGGESPKWLTSDVVKIGGVTSDVTYALQMTFDNRINLSFDGQIKGQLDKEWTDMWIAQLNGAGTNWERAAIGTGHYESLSDFITANSGKTLEELEGEWGVDPTTDPQGRGKSWAIVKGGGSGIFAVVPEPATVVMMLSAALGAIAYGWRRWSRKNQLTVA